MKASNLRMLLQHADVDDEVYLADDAGGFYTIARALRATTPSGAPAVILVGEWAEPAPKPGLEDARCEAVDLTYHGDPVCHLSKGHAGPHKAEVAYDYSWPDPDPTKVGSGR